MWLHPSAHSIIRACFLCRIRGGRLTRVHCSLRRRLDGCNVLFAWPTPAALRQLFDLQAASHRGVTSTAFFGGPLPRLAAFARPCLSGRSAQPCLALRAHRQQSSAVPLRDATLPSLWESCSTHFHATDCLHPTPHTHTHTHTHARTHTTEPSQHTHNVARHALLCQQPSSHAQTRTKKRA